ncbi:hypothetical protein FIV37_03695 [Pseudomonas gessardii]|nr:hypothetical protein [Pseudomonas gessardii]OPK03753.1 hypothetical protein BZ164_14585 [Pseudomonas veronii]RTY74406.1 hypothetical protein EKA83_18520 [Pseudomonas veronii]
MNNAPETPAPVPAHIPKHLARDFDLWAELTAHGENAYQPIRLRRSCPLQQRRARALSTR